MDESSFQAFLSHPSAVWMVVSVLFLLIEAFGIPGVGLMFAGLGALVAGLSVFSGAVAEDNHNAQFILFFVFSLVWAVLLWKPMQKFRVGKRHGEYHNIIGTTAYVGGSGISRKDGGEVTWSGTIMRAELAASAAVDRIESGAVVVIVEVTGATLVVKPK